MTSFVRIESYRKCLNSITQYFKIILNISEEKSATEGEILDGKQSQTVICDGELFWKRNCSKVKITDDYQVSFEAIIRI